jgi:hypothetical protein
MKVYSLYHNETYVASFSNKEDAIFYGKQFYEDGWSCNIVEEYLSKSPLLYSTPYIPPASSTTPTIHNVVRTEPYKDVRANWNEGYRNHMGL